MYDLMEVRTYRPKADYKIDSEACLDSGKNELIAALDAMETSEHRKKQARWRSIITAFVRLVVPGIEAPSGDAVVRASRELPVVVPAGAQAGKAVQGT